MAEEKKIVVKSLLLETMKSLNYKPGDLSEIIESLKSEKEDEEEILLDDLESFFQPIANDIIPKKLELPTQAPNILEILPPSGLSNLFDTRRFVSSATGESALPGQPDIYLCLANIREVESLRGICHYIEKLIQTFKSFRCNFSSVRAFLTKLYEFTYAIGSPNTGLISIIYPELSRPSSSLFDLSSPFSLCVPTLKFRPTTELLSQARQKKGWLDEEIRQLEEILDSSLRYLIRFTYCECLELLVENAAADVFISIHSSLINFLDYGYKRNNISMNAKLMGYQPMLPYLPTANLLKALEFDDDHWEAIKIEKGLTEFEISEIRTEAAWAISYVDAIKPEMKLSTEPSFFVPFASSSLKAFWLSSFGDVNYVTLDIFLSALSNHMHTCNYDTLHAQIFIRRLKIAFLDAMSVPTCQELPPTYRKNEEEDAPTVLTPPSIITTNFLARELNWVPTSMKSTDQSFITHLQHFVDSHRKGLKRYAPPKPNSLLRWNDPNEELQLLEFLCETKGWTVCINNRFTGRTTTLLSLCYQLPEDRDLIYLDLHHSSTEIEALSQVCLQLGLQSCESREEFAIGFRYQLLKLRPNSVVVFDNLESKFSDDSFLSGFMETVLLASSSFVNRMCFVSVGFQPKYLAKLLPTDTTIKIIDIPQLLKENQLSLAQELLPADPSALVSASFGSTAMIFTIANSCNLKTIREAASVVQNNEDFDEYDLKKMDELLSIGFLDQLSDIEKVVVTCVVPGLNPFDVPLVWVLCEAAFEGNQLKWWVAWRGLIASGWFYYRSLGFELSNFADKYSSSMHPILYISGTTLFQDIWDKYYLFWVLEIRRMYFHFLNKCNEGEDPTLASNIFAYFNTHIHHFKSIFACFPLRVDPRILSTSSGINLLPPVSLKRKKLDRMNLTRLPKSLKDQFHTLHEAAEITHTAIRLSTPNPSKLKCSFSEGLAGNLASIISPLLTFHFSPTKALVMLFSIRDCMHQRIDLVRINSDIAEQLIRIGNHAEATALLLQLKTKMQNIDATANALDLIRVNCLLAECFVHKNNARQRQAAIDLYKQSAEILMSPSSLKAIQAPHLEDVIHFTQPEKEILIKHYIRLVKKSLKPLISLDKKDHFFGIDIWDSSSNHSSGSHVSRNTEVSNRSSKKSLCLVM